LPSAKSLFYVRFSGDSIDTSRNGGDSNKHDTEQEDYQQVEKKWCLWVRRTKTMSATMLTPVIVLHLVVVLRLDTRMIKHYSAARRGWQPAQQYYR
jgi:hypothetical protein